MSSGRRRPSSPSAASPLDDDDLLSEILLRLPPQPSSLPRASAVCSRWRSIASDAGFSRRFRRHHRRNPPLLGVFLIGDEGLSFQPTLDAPNRVPPGRFSLRREDDDDGRFIPLGCRHGLVLVFLPRCLHVLVWDPVTGDQHRVAVPPGFAMHAKWIGVNGGGAVLRPAGDAQHFHVVLVVVADNKEIQDKQILACVYSSKTGLWGNLVSTPIPDQADGSSLTMRISNRDDAVLAGDYLYWKLAVGNTVGILEFDLEKQSLAVIQVPAHTYGKDLGFKIMQTEEGGLGFLFVTTPHHTAQLWKRNNTDSDGTASWGLARTIELGKILALQPVESAAPLILGFAEENNAVFLFTPLGLFVIHLDSLKFKKLCDTFSIYFYHPFERVYASGI